MFPSQSPTRTNIVEANKHLKMLYSRIEELETKVLNQEEILIKKDQEFQMAVADLSQRKETEIADLKRTVETCKSQNQQVHKTLLEKDAIIQELHKKCLLFDKIAMHRESLQIILKNIDAVNQTPSGDNRNTKSAAVAVNLSHNNSSTLTKLHSDHHLNSQQDGAEADESNQSSEGESPSPIKELTQSFSRSNIRHFSISEDDSGDERDTVFRKMKREKELYL